MVFWRVLVVGVLGISVVFVGNANALKPEDRIPTFFDGTLVETNPARFVDRGWGWIGEIAIKDGPEDKYFSFPRELRKTVTNHPMQGSTIEPQYPRRAVRHNDAILHKIPRGIAWLIWKIRYTLYGFTSDVSGGNHRGRSSTIPDVNGEPARWSHLGFNDNENPWPFRVNDSLSIQESSVRASLGGSEATSHKRGLSNLNYYLYGQSDYLQESAGGDSECKVERPSVDELFAIFFGSVIGGFLLGLFGLLYVNDKRNAWRTALVALGLGFVVFGFLFLVATGIHPYTWGLPTHRHFRHCQDSEYHQMFEHDGENVSQRFEIRMREYL
jgi:hypothetical protein